MFSSLLRRASPGLLAGAVSASALLNFQSRNDQNAEEEKGAEGPNFSQRLVGNYENRLRALSAPEKVFDYFAKISKEGAKYMTKENFLNAIIPYSYNETRDFKDIEEEAPAAPAPATSKGKKSDSQEPKTFSVFKLADADGDGLISFAEYLFFITLLSVPEHKFEIAFKFFSADKDGTLTKEEFVRVMETMRKSSPMSSQQRSAGFLPDPRGSGLKGSKDLSVQNQGLLGFLFNETSREKLHFSRFKSVLSNLKEEILKFEFQTFNVAEDGTISATDFARSLVLNVPPSEVAAYVERADRVEPELGRVSFADFVAFDRFLHQIDDIQAAVNLLGAAGSTVRKAELTRIAESVVGRQLNPVQVDVLIKVFDVNGDGSLDDKEFLGVLRRRATKGLDQPRDIGVSRYFRRVYDCYHKHQPYV
eukprot:GILI01015720.1.p1 GENE.GILI01015720.1~~GILI01015720.1.p1  ORF type:complete len:420 (+),score=134.63 GILI01015720.1:73-1332(+)